MRPMDGLHTWVINLDRATDRLQRIAGQLDPTGLAWTRVPAVDGRQATAQQRAQLDTAAYRRKHGMEPALGELGCYLSHVAVMQALLDSPYPVALVLEDDVLLTPALLPVLQGLMTHAERWDMVKLSAVHSGTPQPVLELAPGHQLAVMLSRCTGSSAYVVNRRAAEAYRAGLLPMTLPYDHVFDQGWTFGLKVRLVTPTPCIHDEAIATSITAAGSRKFAWLQRLPAHWYRLGNEWRRVRYGLGETRRERALKDSV
jgi:glycosyl transferase, family 25